MAEEEADLHESQSNSHGIQRNVPGLLCHVAELRGHNTLARADCRDDPERDTIRASEDLGDSCVSSHGKMW